MESHIFISVCLQKLFVNGDFMAQKLRLYDVGISDKISKIINWVDFLKENC